MSKVQLPEIEKKDRNRMIVSFRAYEINGDINLNDKVSDWVLCFKAGEYPQGTFTEKDLNSIVKNYDIAYCPAPITIDHKREGEAFGWVHSVKAEEGNLFCKFYKMDENFVKKVNYGKLPFRSIELFYTKEKGLYLRAVTFLGAETPQVKGLGFAKFSNNDLNFSNDTKIFKNRRYEKQMVKEKHFAHSSVIDGYIRDFEGTLNDIQKDKSNLQNKIKEAVRFLDEVASDIKLDGISQMKKYKDAYAKAKDDSQRKKIEYNAKEYFKNKWSYYEEYMDVVYMDILGFSHKNPANFKEKINDLKKFMLNPNFKTITELIDLYAKLASGVDSDEEGLKKELNGNLRFLKEVKSMFAEIVDKLTSLKSQYDSAKNNEEKEKIMKKVQALHKENLYSDEYMEVLYENMLNGSDNSTSIGFADSDTPKKDEKVNDEIEKMKESLTVLEDQIKQLEESGENKDELKKLIEKKKLLEKKINQIENTNIQTQMNEQDKKILNLEQELNKIKFREKFLEIDKFLDRKSKEGKLLPFEHKAIYSFIDGSLMNLKTFINGLDNRRREFFLEFLEKRDISLFKQLNAQKEEIGQVQDLSVNPYKEVRTFKNDNQALHRRIIDYCHRNGLDPDPKKDYQKALNEVLKEVR